MTYHDFTIKQQILEQRLAGTSYSKHKQKAFNALGPVIREEIHDLLSLQRSLRTAYDACAAMYQISPGSDAIGIAKAIITQIEKNELPMNVLKRKCETVQAAARLTSAKDALENIEICLLEDEPLTENDIRAAYNNLDNFEEYVKGLRLSTLKNNDLDPQRTYHQWERTIQDKLFAWVSTYAHGLQFTPAEALLNVYEMRCESKEKAPELTRDVRTALVTAYNAAAAEVLKKTKVSINLAHTKHTFEFCREALEAVESLTTRAAVYSENYNLEKRIALVQRMRQKMLSRMADVSSAYLVSGIDSDQWNAQAIIKLMGEFKLTNDL